MTDPATTDEAPAASLVSTPSPSPSPAPAASSPPSPPRHPLPELSLPHHQTASKRSILPLVSDRRARTPSPQRRPSVGSLGSSSLRRIITPPVNEDGEEEEPQAQAQAPEQLLTTLAPVNAQEQWQIVQSFSLIPSPKSTATTCEEKLDSILQQGMQGTVEDWKRHLQHYGPNELPKAELQPYWKLWIGAFNDIMMILLVIAMCVLYAVGDVIAATAILVILLIATNIGAYTEFTSNQAAAELGDLPGTSLVKFPNHPDAQSPHGWVELINTQLLPGMIVQMQTGDIVPADCILLQTQSPDCSCTEALLTGESEPVSKFTFHSGIDDDDPHVTTKRQAMTRLYMGTEFSGEAWVLIVETGPKTQMGQIFQSMAEEEVEMSPLQIMIDRLIVILAVLSIAASAINAAICIPTGWGVEPDTEDPQALVCTLNSVALTVAAVPENLPVALVIALAAIIKNLATRGVIVKSLPAGEELSRLNYVFSDKTGTLTQNIMTARAIVVGEGHVGLASDFVGPSESTPLESETAGETPLVNQIRLLAAKAQDEVRSNPTGDACKKAMPTNMTNNLKFERVLLEAANSKTKMARVALTINNQAYLVKVGSDWVLDGVTKQATLATDLTNFRSASTHAFDLDTCMEMINVWAHGGYRVICVVAKLVHELPKEIPQDEMGKDFENDFVFLGCLVIQDPPRDDVAENINIIHGAGVIVSMITGDNPITGMSIAKQVGLATDYSEEDMQMCLINAFELFHDMDEEEAKREIIKRLQYSMSQKKGLVIGRVSPFQKRWFVEVAKAMGLVVAMTGDGANDAPALKSANVGIAMGNGSDIAKAAGDMIMVNESFSGIVEAIRAGRLGFDNILKFLLFLLGTNISEVVIYLLLTASNIVIVLDALNLLILNLLTDGFPAIALSVEKAEGDLMKRAPLRRDTSVLNTFTYMSITITNLALLVSYLVVILLGNVWFLGDIRGREGEVDDYDGGLEKVRMMFILLINISELLLGFSHRAPDRSVFSIGMFSGKWMNLAALSSMAIIVFMTHVPGIKGIMRTDYLDVRSYLLVAAMSILPFIVHEIAKIGIFQRLNLSVYELYQYEYVAKDDDEILKNAETEGVADSQEDEIVSDHEPA